MTRLQFLRVFDQQDLWIVFVTTVSLILVVRSLKQIPSPIQKPVDAKENNWANPVEIWTALIAGFLNSRSLYKKWLLAESLFHLYSQLYVDQFGINREQLKTLLKNRETDLPESIGSFFLAGSQQFTSLKIIGCVLLRNKAIQGLETDPVKVVDYLEEFNGK